MAHIVDGGVKNADIGMILHYGTVMLSIALVGAFAAVMRNIFAGRTSQIIGKELRGDIYRKVQTLSLENIDRLQTASVITRITNDVTQIQDFINGSMRMMVKTPIICIGAIALIIIQTPRQIPIMVVILTIASLLIAANMQIGYPRFGKLQQSLDKLNNVSREFLSSIRVVKAFNAEKQEAAKFETASLHMAQAGTFAMQAMAIFSPLINLTVNLGIVVLLYISRRQDISQIGRLMASVNYMTQVLFSMGMVSRIMNNSVRAVASSERIQEILDEVPAQRPAANPLYPDIKGNIDFEDVFFSYFGSSNESLSGVSLRVKSGETVGIIGPTGSGKTTLVNLVPRFYDVTFGKVLIDGNDVTKIDEKTLRSTVAVVPQKALLFTGTIMDNLRRGREDADATTVRRAAEIAQADSFITASEKGYDTLLGQGGVNLSGGQKQRLAIARALLREPKILILDDCTSALDAETEAAVLNGLRKEVRNMTVLLISQRISTVMSANRILCLENGTVQGYGTHEQLLSESPMYRAIYNSQIGGGRND